MTSALARVIFAVLPESPLRMLAVLPLLALVALTCCRLGSRRETSLRAALLTAAVVCGVWVALGSELLSLVGAFSRGPLCCWWLLLLVPSATLAVCRRTALGPRLRPGAALRRGEILAAVGLGIALLLPGAVALVSPPNNVDSLVYHLPRQVYWIQHKSLEHYPAHTTRQLEMPPFAELVGAQLMSLSASDRAANLVQWGALLLLVVAVSLITRELGGDRRAQLTAAALVALIPMAFHEASNPKNDLVVGLWWSISVWLALQVAAEGRISRSKAVWIGCCGGLMVLTKGTALVYGLGSLGLMGWVISRVVRLRGLPILAVRLAVMLLCIALLNAGHWSRNARAFGSVVGSVAEKSYGSKIHTGASLVSGLARNVAIEVALPGAGVNKWLRKQVLALHRGLGLDVNDPRLTFPRTQFAVAYSPGDESKAGAPVHVVSAVLLVLSTLLLLRRVPRAGPFLATLSVPLGSFLLFCFLLQWQPWHPRLHLPMLCLLCAPLAVAVSIGSWRILAGLLVLLCFAAWVPAVATASRRPVLGPEAVWWTDRARLLFSSEPELEIHFTALADRITSLGATRVATHLRGNTKEYCLQRLLLDRDPGVRFLTDDANVSPKGTPLRTSAEPPEVLVIEGEEGPQRPKDRGDITYAPGGEYGAFRLYVLDRLLAGG